MSLEQYLKESLRRYHLEPAQAICRSYSRGVEDLRNELLSKIERDCELASRQGHIYCNADNWPLIKSDIRRTASRLLKKLNLDDEP